jgi:putative peptidoglycan lipid II flippase
MFGRIFTVGGLTLLSRLTGFARDIVLAAVIGAGPVADAFFVALRLPNHFRAIFAEGAFNAAFVPAYARVRQQHGSCAARLFGDRVFTLLFASQLVLLATALLFTPTLIRLLAPGFREDPGRFTLAVELTRITFPYLLLVSLVTLYGGVLNALSRFAAAAAAPVLLNVSMMATLATAAFFPSPGHAAAWGVLLAGILEVLLVGGDALRNDVMAVLRWPKWDDNVRRFFKALLPATIGSAGVQIALFADTIIASFLSAGALSALYYADRLNQLPIGVIGIAVGTVLLPEMANRIAAGDGEGAHRAQARAIELTLVLSIPCLVAFLLIPDLIMRALFMRGAFTAADATAAGRTLAAYAIGLLPFVLIRSVTATFLARGDTATPVKAALTAVGLNVLLKVLLMKPLAQAGLALATSIGAWLNLALVVYFAARDGHLTIGASLRSSGARLAVAGGLLALVLWVAESSIGRIWPAASVRDLGVLAALAGIGAIVYAGTLLLLMGRQWLAAGRL